METTTLNVLDATCASCGAKIVKALEKKYPGIVADYLYTEKKVVIDHDKNISDDDLIKTIKGAGYTAEVDDE